MEKKHVLEVCCGNAASVGAAGGGGAKRIELCRGLSVGGLTPSHGAIAHAVAYRHLDVYVLIRAREGAFVYTQEEVHEMMEDIAYCKTMGCKGVVVGFLTPDADVDELLLARAVACARPMEVTFHRAFDYCRNLPQALEVLVRHGVQRVLTSGGAASVGGGVEMLKQLVQQAKGRIVVMPGGGVTASNIKDLACATGAREYHGTFKQTIKDCGSLGKEDVTSSDDVKAALAVLAAL